MPRKGTRRRVERGIYAWSLPGGKTQYEITYTDSRGKQRWETLPAGQGIQAARALRGVRMAAGGPPAKPARDTFADVADAYLAKKARQVTASTLDGYRRAIERHLNPALGRRAIADIDADDIAEIVADLRDKYAAWSVRTYWTPLVGIFGHALRRRIITENPCRTLEKGERPAAGHASLRFLEGRHEIEALLAAAQTEYWRLMFATLTFTGLRIGELLALLWADIDTRNGFVYVRAQLRDSGERDELLKTTAAHRDVVLIPALASALIRHRQGMRTVPHPRLPVFATETGRIPDRTTIRKYLRRACTKAGIAELSPHALRHTYASILIVEQGEDIVAVSKQLGHAKPSTTLDTYAKFFDRAAHANRLRDGLDGQYGGLL